MFVFLSKTSVVSEDCTSMAKDRGKFNLPLGFVHVHGPRPRPRKGKFGLEAGLRHNTRPVFIRPKFQIIAIFCGLEIIAMMNYPDNCAVKTQLSRCLVGILSRKILV